MEANTMLGRNLIEFSFKNLIKDETKTIVTFFISLSNKNVWRFKQNFNLGIFFPVDGICTT